MPVDCEMAKGSAIGATLILLIIPLLLQNIEPAQENYTREIHLGEANNKKMSQPQRELKLAFIIIDSD